MARKLLGLSIDIDEERLNHAIEVLNENNLSLEHAVKLFLYSVSNNHRLPFSTIDEKLSDSNSYLKDIADVLAGRYDYIYYVNVDDNSYLEFNMNNSFRVLEVGDTGKDFFYDSYHNIDMVIYKEDRQRMVEFLNKDNMIKNLNERGSDSIVYRMITSVTPEYYLLTASYVGANKHQLILEVRNIDDSIRKEQQQARELEKASNLAHLDSLTKCLNYLAFQEARDELSLRIKNGENNFAILMCDLNDLKNINDDEGHLVGDEFLIKTADTLRSIFQNSKVYRIGGDEFFVVLENEDFNNRYSLLDVLKNRSKENIKNDAPVIAVGLAELGDDITDFISLFMKADQRMYEHKKQLKQEK